MRRRARAVQSRADFPELVAPCAAPDPSSSPCTSSQSRCGTRLSPERAKVPAVPARYRPAGCSPVRMSGVAAWPVSQNLISDHPEVHIRRLHYLLNKSLLQSISALDTANPVLDRMHNGSVHFFCAPALADSLKSMRSVVEPESGRCCDKDMVQKNMGSRSFLANHASPR